MLVLYSYVRCSVFQLVRNVHSSARREPKSITCMLALCHPHSLLGARAILLDGALPFESTRCLAVADEALQQGASVRLIVPLPASGEVSRDDGALKLLQRSSRLGFPELMAAMGYHWGVPGQYSEGNRPRIDFVHCRADDIETLNLELADSDLLLLRPPAQPIVDRNLERARWRMQRQMYSLVLDRLKARGVPLQRDRRRANGNGDGADDDPGAGVVHWAWLAETGTN